MSFPLRIHIIVLRVHEVQDLMLNLMCFVFTFVKPYELAALIGQAFLPLHCLF